jgi:hypothetical protein
MRTTYDMTTSAVPLGAKLLTNLIMFTGRPCQGYHGCAVIRNRRADNMAHFAQWQWSRNNLNREDGCCWENLAKSHVNFISLWLHAQWRAVLRHRH